jgi:hypothetical protein
MIDSLVKVAEKLVELLKYRKQLREEQFAKSIDMVFQELKNVHQDYLKLFSNCAQALREKEDLSQIADSLFANRLEHEAMRRSIRALAESLAQNKTLKKFQPFFMEVNNYFQSGTFPNDTRSSALLNELERCVRERRQGHFVSREFTPEELHQFVSQLVENTLTEVRASWDELSQLHAKALSETLK